MNEQFASIFAARGMKLIKTFPRGATVFARLDGVNPNALLPSSPCELQVWFDPPLPCPKASKCTDSELIMAFPATVAEVPNLPLCVLADTGASTEFISLSFITKHRLALRPSKLKSATLADDSKTISIVGKTNLTLEFEGARIVTTFTVVDAPTGPYDLILGETFFSRHKATLDYNLRALTLTSRRQLVIIPACCRRGSTRVEYSPGEPLGKAREKGETHEMRTGPRVCAALITISEARKEIKRGARAHMFWVKPEFVPNSASKRVAPSKPSSPAPISFMCCPKTTVAGSRLSTLSAVRLPSINGLLDEFADVFEPP
ncbi:MAG: retroviral-like aspartic protease, partial [Sphingobacteriia bacterium]|nr:retroviral-like aspartic protease [Sphingobacteriia bacterium]